MLQTVLEKHSLFGGLGTSLMNNHVNPAIHNVFQSGTQAATTEIKNLAGGVMKNVMPSVAPWLMLPIAMGLMGNMGQDGQQPQQGIPNPQFNPIQPNYYGPTPVIPQGFKTTTASVKEVNFSSSLKRQIKKAGAGTTAVALGVIHKKLVSNAIDKITEKKETEQQATIPTTPTITPENKKTEKLFKSPKVKSYLDNLINN